MTAAARLALHPQPYECGMHVRADAPKRVKAFACAHSLMRAVLMAIIVVVSEYVLLLCYQLPLTID